MIIYGIKSKDSPEGFVPMQAVSFVGSPATLRAIASFFVNAAEALENPVSQFNHAHARNVLGQWQESWPDIIIARGKESNHT